MMREGPGVKLKIWLYIEGNLKIHCHLEKWPRHICGFGRNSGINST
jgi:hypothetical protein